MTVHAKQQREFYFFAVVQLERKFQRMANIKVGASLADVTFQFIQTHPVLGT